MSDLDLGYDDLDLDDNPPDADGLGLLHAQGQRQDREKTPRKRYAPGPAAPAPTAISVLKSNLQAATAELEAARKMYSDTDSLSEQVALSQAVNDLEAEVSSLSQDVRVWALKNSDPTVELALAAEAARDAVNAYKSTHPTSYDQDVTFTKLCQAEADAWAQLETTKLDVHLRDERAQAAAMVEGSARMAGDRAVKAELARLEGEMKDLGKQGRYAEAGELQKAMDKLATSVPEKTAQWQRAYAEARTEYLLAAKGAL